VGLCHGSEGGCGGLQEEVAAELRAEHEPSKNKEVRETVQAQGIA